ncbi:MAG: Orotidine 5'-phosphate decarboxylase [Candidatus Methanolliviera sp. GoM_asphalt]|nr:MAG: Orotidine 5'-phosphate decarboxylase [Candidatus Methanolliviera sp. GoM_asphalt]
MSGLILALDVIDKKRALKIVEETKASLDYVKVGYPLILSTGINIMEKISELMPVIADLKVADIPDINELICRETFRNGAKGIICHGFTGRDSLKACIDVSREFDGDIYVVADMSHPGASAFFPDISVKICDIAMELGAEGIVSPANRPERLRKIKKRIKKLKLLSPGIGVQGGSIRDAIFAGADYLIIGRSIYMDKNPKTAAERIKKAIEEADDEEFPDR